MAKNQRYPRTLFKRSENGKRSFTNKTNRDMRYDELIVEDEKEQKAAEEMGYIDGFSDSLFHVKEEELPKEF